MISTPHVPIPAASARRLAFILLHAFGTLLVCSGSVGQEMAALPGHADYVVSVAFSPDGATLVSGGGTTVNLWDTASFEVVHTLEMLSSAHSVAFSPDGATVASSGNFTVWLWDTVSGQEFATLTGHSTFIKGLAFSPDGGTLASGSSDRAIRLWDIATGAHYASLGQNQWVLALAYSPDGRTLASGYGNGTVTLWDVSTLEPVASLGSHSEHVLSVAYSPSGSTLATASDDDTVKLWDIASGEEIATFQGHSGDAESVSFSPDGLLLASGSRDASVKIWDIASGQVLVSFQPVAASVNTALRQVRAVKFSPDGQILATGTTDSVARLWDVASLLDPALVSISDVAVTEGDPGTAIVTLTASLSRAALSEITVDFATVDGTASSGADYTSAQGTLTFPAGTTTASIDIAMAPDLVDELDEAFGVILSNPSNSILNAGNAQGNSSGLDHTATVTILDDDAVAITVDDATAAESRGAAR